MDIHGHLPTFMMDVHGCACKPDNIHVLAQSISIDIRGDLLHLWTSMDIRTVLAGLRDERLEVPKPCALAMGHAFPREYAASADSPQRSPKEYPGVFPVALIVYPETAFLPVFFLSVA